MHEVSGEASASHRSFLGREVLHGVGDQCGEYLRNHFTTFAGAHRVVQVIDHGEQVLMVVVELLYLYAVLLGPGHQRHHLPPQRTTWSKLQPSLDARAGGT